MPKEPGQSLSSHQSGEEKQPPAPSTDSYAEAKQLGSVEARTDSHATEIDRLRTTLHGKDGEDGVVSRLANLQGQVKIILWVLGVFATLLVGLFIAIVTDLL